MDLSKLTEQLAALAQLQGVLDALSGGAAAPAPNVVNVGGKVAKVEPQRSRPFPDGDLSPDSDPAMVAERIPGAIPDPDAIAGAGDSGFKLASNGVPLTRKGDPAYCHADGTMCFRARDLAESGQTRKLKNHRAFTDKVTGNPAGCTVTGADSLDRKRAQRLAQHNVAKAKRNAS